MPTCTAGRATNRTRVTGTARPANRFPQARRSTKNGEAWSRAYCRKQEEPQRSQSGTQRPQIFLGFPFSTFYLLCGLFVPLCDLCGPLSPNQRTTKITKRNTKATNIFRISVLYFLS